MHEGGLGVFICFWHLSAGMIIHQGVASFEIDELHTCVDSIGTTGIYRQRSK